MQALNQINNPASQNTTTSADTLNNNINTQTSSQQVSLTWDEVKKHNNPKDCWHVIADNVYDATNYANLHPGGETSIYQYYGQDATTAFQTKGDKGLHSDKALQILSQLYIGKLGEKVKNSPQKPAPNVNRKDLGYSEGEDEGLEFEDN
ncbi:MAG: hypothetical protein KatS3mg090_0404 [Patescibacteria group bacterium]|nr:MAG: hypothetical protein KatS3mg090_0404 [Patescibacteria group bacterium]